MLPQPNTEKARPDPASEGVAGSVIQRQKRSALSGGKPLYEAQTTTRAPLCGMPPVWSSNVPTVTA